MTLAAPYIGITGITDVEDVGTVRECVAVARSLVPTHRVMAGVLVSRKTLIGEVVTNRRYPDINGVNGLLGACLDVGAWPTVHYNTRSEKDQLLVELEILHGHCPAMQGLQLNVVTPYPATVREFCLSHPEIEVILQINGSSIKATGLTPRSYAMVYRGPKHALLDASGGTGRVFSPDVADTLLETQYSLAELGVRMGLAGGLGPGCQSRLTAIRNSLATYRGFNLRDLSLDAESGVRVPVPDPIEGEPYQDMLDRNKALAYVKDVSAAIQETP
jgi:hypothetical protein